jgi:hypothetical protein
MAQTQTTLHALAATRTAGGGHNQLARSNNPKTASAPHRPVTEVAASINTAGPMANAQNVRTLRKATRSLPCAPSEWEDADGNGMTGV